MCRAHLRTVSAGLLLALASCFGRKEPAAEYWLSKEQLAWQGYRAGQVLRFGNAQSNAVRTYRVTQIRDSLETQFTGAVGPTVPFPQGKPPLYQQLVAVVQRTDLATGRRYALTMGQNYDPHWSRPQLRAEASWETFFSARLPIDEVNAGLPIDTLTYPATEFLREATFGTSRYDSVIHLTYRHRNGTAPAGARPTRQLYYARGKGVVAYDEEGTGLWYRLP